MQNPIRLDLAGVEVTPFVGGGKIRRKHGNGKRVAVPEEFPDEPRKQLDELVEKYTQVSGPAISKTKLNKIKSKSLRNTVEKQENLVKETAMQNAKAQFLLLDEEIPGYIESEERHTSTISQKELVEKVDASMACRKLDLNLGELGPYGVDFTRNGRKILLFGRKGHISVIDSQTLSLDTEIQAKQTVHDAKFLHNQSMIAVAQKNYVHIYDQKGIELHCLRNHRDVNLIDFLPFHFLLSSVSSTGWLRYQDTSTGQVVANIRTGLGPASSMRHNPANGIMNVGHTRGLVTMWAPKMSKPAVKMLAERGPVLSIGVGKEGRDLITTGMDGTVKLWDIRNFREEVQVFTIGKREPVTSVDVSQTGLVALGHGNRVEVWKGLGSGGVKEQYLSEYYAGKTIRSVRFMPYDDFLGVGHSEGFSTMICPGAGLSNFDTFEANPFESKSQRQEKEVRMVMDKLQPEMITMESDFVGSVDRRDPKVIAAEVKEAESKLSPEQLKEKHRMRGRSSAKKKFMRKKRLNIIDKHTVVQRDESGSREIGKKMEKQAQKSVLDRFQ